MKIGIIGRTNVGKSTLFKSLTLEDIAIENRPFTTIEPNHGIGYVTIECPEKRFKTKCNPNNAPCINGQRFVPIELIDVAGLIEGAHEGQGLANKFLSNAMEADALINVIDLSGTTDSSGSESTEYDPARDIKMVHDEIIQWVKGIIMKNKIRSDEDLTTHIYKSLTGLKIKQDTVKDAVKLLQINSRLHNKT